MMDRFYAERLYERPTYQEATDALGPTYKVYDRKWKGSPIATVRESHLERLLRALNVDDWAKEWVDGIDVDAMTAIGEVLSAND